MEWTDYVKVEVLSKGQPSRTQLEIKLGRSKAFKTTLSAIASLYQKAVRRGDAFWTVVCVTIYYRAGNSFAAFNRLRGFALEDKAGSCAELLEKIEKYTDQFKEAYSKKTGVSKSNLRAGQAEELFPEGLNFAVDAALNVCWCRSSRIGAMLAFTGLSAAVSEDMPEDSRPSVLRDYKDDLDAYRERAIKEVALAWRKYKIGYRGVRPSKLTNAQHENFMLELMNEMYVRLYEGKPMPRTYMYYAVHRLGFATMAAELCLGLESGVDEEYYDYPQFRNADELPEWALDKHTTEGRQKLAAITRHAEEDMHTLGLKNMFSDSFELEGHEVNQKENRFWDNVGRATYMWWDAYHLRLLGGKKRKYSLGKTKHLLDYWVELDGGKAPTVPAPKPPKPAKKAPSKLDAILEREENQSAASSSRASSSLLSSEPAVPEKPKKQKPTPAKSYEPQLTFEPLDESKEIGFPLSILKTMYCAAQLPTRTGKRMLTYYTLNENGQRVWRKGPFEEKLWPEVWAEIDADVVFDVLHGVEGRGLKQISIDGQVFIESAALFWPPSFDERESTVLNIKSLRVGVMPTDASVRSLTRLDIGRLAEGGEFELLLKIVNASILKRELGCNDLVLRNLIVDFANKLVYPIDCTVLEGERKPAIFHGAAENVRNIMTDRQVKLQPELYKSWARQLKPTYPTAAVNLLQFASLGSDMKNDLFPSKQTNKSN